MYDRRQSRTAGIYNEARQYSGRIEDRDNYDLPSSELYKKFEETTGLENMSEFTREYGKETLRYANQEPIQYEHEKPPNQRARSESVLNVHYSGTGSRAARYPDHPEMFLQNLEVVPAGFAPGPDYNYVMKHSWNRAKARESQFSSDRDDSVTGGGIHPMAIVHNNAKNRNRIMRDRKIFNSFLVENGNRSYQIVKNANLNEMYDIGDTEQGISQAQLTQAAVRDSDAIKRSVVDLREEYNPMIIRPELEAMVRESTNGRSSLISKSKLKKDEQSYKASQTALARFRQFKAEPTRGMTADDGARTTLSHTNLVRNRAEKVLSRLENEGKFDHLVVASKTVDNRSRVEIIKNEIMNMIAEDRLKTASKVESNASRKLTRESNDLIREVISTMPWSASMANTNKIVKKSSKMMRDAVGTADHGKSMTAVAKSGNQKKVKAVLATAADSPMYKSMDSTVRKIIGKTAAFVDGYQDDNAEKEDMVTHVGTIGPRKRRNPREGQLPFEDENIQQIS